MRQYTFSANLKRIRKERGLSQFALAEKAGISQASISFYEKNVKYPTFDRVYDLAGALGVEAEDLISAHPKNLPKEN